MKLKPKNFNFYICLSHDYSSCDKGQIYPKWIIGIYLLNHPEDFKGVDDLPSIKQIIKVLKSDNLIEKNKILKILNQWKIK